MAAAGPPAATITATGRRTNSAASVDNRSIWFSAQLVFDRYVLALDIASVLQALAKCAQTVRIRVWRHEIEKPDHRHPRLLRPRCERPRGHRATEQRDEVAALQWIELHRCPPARPDP
jgi:hypothetical protein